MRQSSFLAGLCASALLCTGTAARAAEDDTLSQIKQQIELLKQQQGKYTVNAGSLAIESWLLTSSAIDRTADSIGDSIRSSVVADAPRAREARVKHLEALKKQAKEQREPEPNQTIERKILVVTGAEPLDFSTVVMLDTEIKALTERLARVCDCVTGGGTQMYASGAMAPALIGAAASLLRSDTELTAIEQTVDAKLLAAAVADKLNAILPASAIASGSGGRLIRAFNEMVDTADEAQVEYERLSEKEKPSAAEKEKVAKLKRLLDRYDALYGRLTTASNGVVPLAYAARLQELMDDDPYVLRVNTEKAGGTLVKRTNILTALGAESAFISGGLVSSYQLTDPVTGELIKAGVVTCRTTLTSLKRVQDASWNSSEQGRKKGAVAICSP